MKMLKFFFNIFKNSLLSCPDIKQLITFPSFAEKNCISKTFNEIRLNGTPNPTYELPSKTTDTIIFENSSFSNSLENDY